MARLGAVVRRALGGARGAGAEGRPGGVAELRVRAHGTGLHDVCPTARLEARVGTVAVEVRRLAREADERLEELLVVLDACLLYTSPSPRDGLLYRMPSSA